MRLAAEPQADARPLRLNGGDSPSWCCAPLKLHGFDFLPLRRFGPTQGSGRRAIFDDTILPAPNLPRYEAIVQTGSYPDARPCTVCARAVGFRGSSVLETQRFTRDYKPPISTDWRLAALQLGT